MWDMHINPEQAPGRFHGVLLSIEQFSLAVVRSHLEERPSATAADDCFRGAYYRAASYVGSLIRLDDVSHFQAISMLARSMFELAVDVRLMRIVPNAAEKVIGHCDVEKLRSARKTVAIADGATSAVEALPQREFVKNREVEIAATQQRLWPNARRVDHWSGVSSLPDRASRAGADCTEAYELRYAELSWDVHPGLTGVIGLGADIFPLKCAQALGFATDWYRDILNEVGKHFRLGEVQPQFLQHLELARLLPMTDTDEEREQLAAALLND